MGINQEIEKPTLGPTGFRGRVMGLLAPGLQDQLDALTTEGLPVSVEAATGSATERFSHGGQRSL